MKRKNIFLYFFAVLFLCGTSIVVGQTGENVSINGLVLSKGKCSLPDVLIRVADSEIETRTDSAGRFSLNCPMESYLIFWPDSTSRYNKAVCKLMRKPGVVESEYTFILNYATGQKCSAKRVHNKVMLQKTSQSHILEIVAMYNSNIRETTLKLLDRYTSRTRRVGFVIDGIYYSLMDKGKERFPDADLVLTDGSGDGGYFFYSFDNVDSVFVSSTLNGGYTFIFVTTKKAQLPHSCENGKHRCN